MKRLTILILPLILLAGCATTNTTGGTTPPPPPTPPQITVANSMLALSHALNGATDALIACRQQSKCDAADVTAAENVISAIAMVGKQIDAELVSTDPWATQKTAILKDITAAGLVQLKAKVSPSTQLLITSVVAIFDNVSLAVGGPTI